MKIIEMKVSLEEAEKIFNIIEEVLVKNINTQVQIENNILEELRKNKTKHKIHSSRMCVTSHYNTEGNCVGEKWYIFAEEKSFNKAIAKASFINNFINCHQLVQYRSDKIPYYKHFNVKFEQLLIICKE